MNGAIIVGKPAFGVHGIKEDCHIKNRPGSPTYFVSIGGVWQNAIAFLSLLNPFRFEHQNIIALSLSMLSREGRSRSFDKRFNGSSTRS